MDVVEVLTESTYANRYWSDLKIQLSEKEGFDQLYEKIVRLKLEAPLLSSRTSREFLFENQKNVI